MTTLEQTLHDALQNENLRMALFEELDTLTQEAQGRLNDALDSSDTRSALVYRGEMRGLDTMLGRIMQLAKD